MVKAFKTTGSIRVAPRSGRLKITTEAIDRIIARTMKQNRRLSAETMRGNLAEFQDKDIYYVKYVMSTIRQRIRDAGLHGRAARKKPHLSKANRAKRLAYAKKIPQRERK
jgi:hypothetical protein